MTVRVCQRLDIECSRGCGTKCVLDHVAQPVPAYQPASRKKIMRDTTRIIEPPEFAPRPRITDTMGPDALWSYACLCGYRYKLSEHDKALSTQPAQPVSEPSAVLADDAEVSSALTDLQELWDFAASMKCHPSMMRRWSKSLGVVESLAASRSAKQAQPASDANEGLTSRQIAVRLHDYPILQAFHSKHALGPLAAPSCLCCGRSMQGAAIGVQHLELPGVVICAPCKKASAQPVSEPAQAVALGMVMAPEYRGYANLGTGQYIPNHTSELPAELIISIATDAEKSGRAVGDSRNLEPRKSLRPEDMAVRLRFGNVAGLDALEQQQQLRFLREEFFPGTATQPVSEPSGGCATGFKNERGEHVQVSADARGGHPVDLEMLVEGESVLKRALTREEARWLVNSLKTVCNFSEGK